MLMAKSYDEWKIVMFFQCAKYSMGKTKCSCYHKTCAFEGFSYIPLFDIPVGLCIRLIKSFNIESMGTILTSKISNNYPLIDQFCYYNTPYLTFSCLWSPNFKIAFFKWHFVMSIFEYRIFPNKGPGRKRGSGGSYFVTKNMD